VARPREDLRALVEQTVRGGRRVRARVDPLVFWCEVRALEPSASVAQFGSSVNQLAQPTSDLDLTLLLVIQTRR
jgi:hypothetical protein